MRKKNVVKSFKYGIIFSILIMLMTFWVRKVFFDTLGTELTGYYLLINQMLGFLNLAELGLGTASTYLLFKPLNDNDNLKLATAIQAIKNIYSIIQKVIFGLGLLIAVLLPFIVKSQIDIYYLYIPWILFVLSTALSFSFSAESILLTADQKVYYIRIINGSGRVLCFLFQIIALKNDLGFITFSVLEVVSVLLQLYFFKKIIKQNYSFLSEIDESILKSTKKNIFLEVKKTFIHKVSGVLIFNTDYIIVSIFLGLAFVTSYSSYIMLLQAMSFLITTLSVPLNSALGHHLQEKGNDATVIKFTQINSIFMCISSILSFCYYVASSGLIIHWLGKSVVLPESTVVLLAINCFCLIARTSVDIFKVAYGYMSDTHLPILEGGVNLLFSLILVQFLGINGVVIGTIISNVCIIMIARPYYLFNRAFKKQTTEFLMHHGAVWLLSALTVFILYLIFIKNMNYMETLQTSSFNDFIINCSILGVLSSAIGGLIFIIGSNDFRTFIKQQLLIRF